MPNFSQLLNEEIRRLARKEVRAAVAPLLEANSALRKRIAELEKQAKAFAKERPEQAQKPVAEGDKAPQTEEKKLRITPDRIKKLRMKLGLSQTQFGKLLGATTLSVNKWESGKSTPRKAFLQRIAELRDSGKRELAKMMEEKQVSKRMRRVKGTVAKKAAAQQPAQSAPAPVAEQAAPAVAPVMEQAAPVAEQPVAAPIAVTEEPKA